MKAADISDDEYLAALDEAARRMGRTGYDAFMPRQFVTNVLRETRPDLPEKVSLAKARSLIKRKKLAGCACGCRGDFERPVTETP